MLSRLSLVVFIAFVTFATGVEAAEQSGFLRGASCSVVRFYVAKFSVQAAESWARNHGATEAEIEAARLCLRNSPVQPTQTARWVAQ
jgi:hypothetical protein